MRAHKDQDLLLTTYEVMIRYMQMRDNVVAEVRVHYSEELGQAMFMLYLGRQCSWIMILTEACPP